MACDNLGISCKIKYLIMIIGLVCEVPRARYSSTRRTILVLV